MSTTAKDLFTAQLQSVIAEVDNILKGHHDDLSDLGESDLHLGLSRLRAAIERAAGTSSTYVQHLNRLDKECWADPMILPRYKGVAQSLLADLQAGYTQRYQELVHSEVFSDYLEMASHLLDLHYKDAAAVIIGSTLENHLRNLCRKHGVVLDLNSANGPRPKKADQLNADLFKAGAYGLLDQKNVTAWLDLRNKAAHGLYTEYTKGEVLLLLQNVRDFIARNPA